MIKRTWYIIDATNKVLGRLSSAVVKYLIGKHKSNYTPYNDMGDYVIVINAKSIYVSGKKREKKIYYKHTGYIGGIKQSTFQHMISVCPTKIIEIAVKGMLPKNNLGRSMFNRLKVFEGDSHIHTAQLPKFLVNLY